MFLNNTVTSVYIRPEVVEKLSTKNGPCSHHENYSYTRVSGGESVDGWALGDADVVHNLYCSLLPNVFFSSFVILFLFFFFVGGKILVIYFTSTKKYYVGAL